MASAARSLTLPPGLRDSSLPCTTPPPSGETRARRTSGVPPMSASASSATGPGRAHTGHALGVLGGAAVALGGVPEEVDFTARALLTPPFPPRPAPSAMCGSLVRGAGARLLPSHHMRAAGTSGLMLSSA